MILELGSFVCTRNLKPELSYVVVFPIAEMVYLARILEGLLVAKSQKESTSFTDEIGSRCEADWKFYMQDALLAALKAPRLRLCCAPESSLFIKQSGSCSDYYKTERKGAQLHAPKSTMCV